MYSNEILIVKNVYKLYILYCSHMGTSGTGVPRPHNEIRLRPKFFRGMPIKLTATIE